MVVYILKRIIWALLTALMASFLVFTIMYFVPGDPVKIMIGPEATPAMIEAKKAALGLEDSYWVRLAHFYEGIFLHFDFGESWVYHAPVTDQLLERFPRTMAIAGICILLQIVVGTPLGIVAAVKRNRWPDRVAMFIAMFGISMPNFWIALMLILLFSVQLGWLEHRGFTEFQHYIMPSLANAFPGICTQARQTRSSMLDVIRSDYVTTARAKGVSESRIIFRHALPNALLPLVTILGNGMGMLLGGAVVIELIFGIPGVGEFLLKGIANRDYNVVQSSVIFLSLALTLCMLLVDVVYTLVDPRVKGQFVRKQRRSRHG